MTIGQGLAVWLGGAVGLLLLSAAAELPLAFLYVLEGVWAVASALLGLAVWRGDRRP